MSLKHLVKIMLYQNCGENMYFKAVDTHKYHVIDEDLLLQAQVLYASFRVLLMQYYNALQIMPIMPTRDAFSCAFKQTVYIIMLFAVVLIFSTSTKCENIYGKRFSKHQATNVNNLCCTFFCFHLLHPYPLSYPKE